MDCTLILDRVVTSGNLEGRGGEELAKRERDFEGRGRRLGGVLGGEGTSRAIHFGGLEKEAESKNERSG